MKKKKRQQQRHELAAVVADVLLRDLVAHEHDERLHGGGHPAGHAVLLVALDGPARDQDHDQRDEPEEREVLRREAVELGVQHVVHEHRGRAMVFAARVLSRGRCRVVRGRGRVVGGRGGLVGGRRGRLRLVLARREKQRQQQAARDHWRRLQRSRPLPLQHGDLEDQEDDEVGEQRQGERDLRQVQPQHRRHDRRQHHAHPADHASQHRSHEGVRRSSLRPPHQPVRGQGVRRRQRPLPASPPAAPTGPIRSRNPSQTRPSEPSTTPATMTA